MRKFTVETLEQWNILAAKLKDRGYKPWQYQYSWHNPEGLHVWFAKQGKEDVEVITHSEEIHKAIYKFNT
jgi:hypothetical protein